LCHRAHQKYAGFKGGALSGGFGAVFGLLLGGSISAALFDNMVSLKTGIIVGLGIGLAVGISLFILIAGFHLKRQNMSLLHPHSSWWTVIAVLSALALIRWNLPTAVSVIDTRAPDAPPDLENLFTMRRDLLIPLIAQSFMCTLLSVAGLQAVWSILEMRCVPEDSKMKPASTIVFNPGYESFNEDTEEEEEALYTRVLPRIRSRLQLTTNDVYGQGETRTEPPSMSTFGFGQRRATGIFHIRAPSDEESDEEKGGSPLYDQALLRSGSNSPVYEQPAMMQARIVAQQEEEEALGTHPFYQLAQPVNSSDGSGDEAGSESSAEA
jgi:protein-S-isoprenylcysteine O-methyltransferase Ste14